MLKCLPGYDMFTLSSEALEDILLFLISRSNLPHFLICFELSLLFSDGILDCELSMWLQNMGETRDNDAYEEELLDYEEEEEKAPDSSAKVNGEGAKKYAVLNFEVDIALSINSSWIVIFYDISY